MVNFPEPPIEKLRIPCVRKARLSHAGGTEEAFVVDIGLCGVFVERTDPLAVGTKVDLEMLLPGNEIPFRAQCRVAWTHEAETGPLQTKSLPTGIGLELVDVSQAHRDHIRELLLTYLQQNPETRRFLRHWPEEIVRTDDPLADEQGV